MDFNHTDERRMLADALGRYLAVQYSIQERHRIAEVAGGYCPKQWRSFADMGVIGALFDPAHGGYGGAGFDIAVVFEAVGKGLVLEPLLPSLLAGSALACSQVQAHQELLGRIVEGGHIATLATEEESSHYNLNHVATRAVRQGAGYVLHGRKIAVPLGAQAASLLVPARTSGEVGTQQGISLFLVPTDAQGLEVRGYRNVDGSRSADLCMHGVHVDSAALIGEEGAGYGVIEWAVARGVLALCAESLGAMEVVKSATIEYLKTRQQFGKPIGSFQALQHRIVEVLIEIEQARSTVINAAAALDADRAVREKAVSAAKYNAGSIGRFVAEACIQLHGGIGMTWELPVAHYAKRLVAIDHLLGDEDHHLGRFIQFQGGMPHKRSI